MGDGGGSGGMMDVLMTRMVVMAVAVVTMVAVMIARMTIVGRLDATVVAMALRVLVMGWRW